METLCSQPEVDSRERNPLCSVREREMKTGKKRITNSDPVESSPPPSSDLPTADGGDEDSLKNSADSWKRDDAEEPVEEEDADEEDSEAEREYEQDENVPIEEAGGERTKLADGFYELEAVRRKRVRKVNCCLLLSI